MANQVYLALYKGKGDWKDGLIRFFTKGLYSHCEIIIVQDVEIEQYDWRKQYDFYSSSPRDGGVRHIQKDYLNLENWDLIKLENVTKQQITAYFNRTCGAKYDWWGVFGIVFGIKQKRSKYFCSEWCGELLGLSESWRFSPNDLATIFKREIK
ncbi:enoyl-CoA hydratase [Caviibacterium pharyngocola]|uniref:Enoyl-CoA hydratase n=1 Tax=Caviibacterium pharyngocola TaxID=28159 RepID=A0A2M8RXZ1_9PAST|nr:enoyl-CoA hydratase [Caviibacterium pharyngocola]PJG83757.1 enoyl-CoA hydratase [Caviibacterium pharyngocola]